MTTSICFVSFTKLSVDDLKNVLDLRNLPYIKEHMVNDKDISLSEHLSFCQSLKHMDDKFYFAIKYEKRIVGVINFNDIKLCKWGGVTRIINILILGIIL